MISSLKTKSIALIIPDFDYGGEEKRVVYFANNYLNYFKNVILFAPDGLSNDLLDSRVKHIKTDVRKVKNVFNVLRELKKNHVDFVQGHKRLSQIYLLLSEKFLGTVSVFNYDNIYLKGNKVSSFLAPKHVIYLSDVLKDFYKPMHAGKNNVTINMGGEFFNAYSPSKISALKAEYAVENQFVILSLGRLSPQKNQKLLLEVLKDLDNSSYICLIAGSGPLEEELKQQVQAYGITDKVRFIGHTTAIADLLNVSDVLVQSSIFEGFPNVFIEAASVGLPIIATDVGSSRTLISNNGIIVPSEDPAALKEAIKTMIDKYDDYKQNAVSFKDTDYFKQFRKDVMLDNYVKFYAEVSGL